MNRRTSVALAIGDPNGIGPELAVKAASLRSHLVLVGDPFVIRDAAECLESKLRFGLIEGGRMPPDDEVAILPISQLTREEYRPGVVSPAAGQATVAYVEAGLAFVQAGHATALVACPHSESVVNAAGIAFSGYPSLLARLTGVAEDHVFLLLLGGGLRIVHVTLHEGLQDALRRFTPELVEAAGRAAIAALVRLGIASPRVGIFGINPHAGEGGLFGQNDELVTAPAAARLSASGIVVEGPLGADLLLARRNCDVFVAMYHDQGHIPVKLLAGRDSAAMSVGAGLIFSSVGHGSGFDIAGQGRADPAAVLRAVDLVSGTVPP